MQCSSVLQRRYASQALPGAGCHSSSSVRKAANTRAAIQQRASDRCHRLPTTSKHIRILLSKNARHLHFITPAVPSDASAPAASLPPPATESDVPALEDISDSVVPSVQEDAAALPASKPKGGMAHRWKLISMMAVAFILCNMDKVNMSVAVIPMARELGWTATERGLVSSAFFWGYSLTQIPAGWISTRIGGAKVLMAGVALWSFGTLIAPPAAKLSIVALCASRVLVGLGEGFAPSAATNVMARQVPSWERSRAVTTVFGGLDVGSAVGLLLCGPLIRMYGWPSVFYLFAALGLVWCLFWPMFNPDKRDEIMETPGEAGSSSMSADGKDSAPVPWGAFMTSPPVWAVIVAHFCFNWGYYSLLAWLPSYFELALGLDVQKSSFLTLIPYVAMTIMTPLVGPVADGLVKRGTPLTVVRKLCQGIAFVGPAICMLAVSLFTPTAAAPATPASTLLLVGLLSLGFALGAWSRAGLYCNHQDLSPKYAGALLGITNTAGALPGVLGVTAAGYLLDMTGSWNLALFYPTACCQIFGAIVYSMLASSERQSWS